MFDYTHKFEELPIRIDGHAVAYVDGKATLEQDWDYEYLVRAIEVEVQDEERVIRLSPASDDSDKRRWFHELAEELQDDEWARECFYDALEEYRKAA